MLGPVPLFGTPGHPARHGRESRVPSFQDRSACTAMPDIGVSLRPADGSVVVRMSVPAALEDLVSKPLLKAERGCIVHNSIRDAVTVRFTHEWR